MKQTKSKCHHHHHEKNCCGDKKDTKCCFQKKEARRFDDLRRALPNEPTTLGSSTALEAQEFNNMPIQSGDQFSTGLKFEYDENVNKYSLPGLKVTNTFDLVPSAEEAGVMNAEILDAGYDVAPFFWPRGLSSQWYGITQDEENFYYAVWGSTLFASFFGFGTSSVYVARKKCDASLVWVKSCWDYSLDIPKQPNFVGSTNLISRVALAVHKDRLYTTTVFSNIGPQLYVIDKKTGNPIWTMAYYLPAQLQIDSGSTFLVSPSTPINSFDGSPYVGQTFSLGDLNVQVVELEQNKVSVFVGVASNQNALNPASFSGFPEYVDQGQLIRIDDLGATGTVEWRSTTCADFLNIGDVITTSTNPIDEPDKFNPFRPGSDIVYIWRDTTADGKFLSAGGADAAILDYNGLNPGYIPLDYPFSNNLTTPAVANIFLFEGGPVLTEASVPLLFRSAAPGVGSMPVIYENDFTGIATDITARLVEWNAIQAGLSPGESLKITYWVYIDSVTVAAINALGDASENVGVRYIAFLPDGYTISNQQEAEALNYFGNSVWGQAPTIDIQRGLIYYGTGQAHSCPVDELLFYQNPAVEYLTTKQPVIDRMYEYARPDSSTNGAPFSTLQEVNDAKDLWVADIKAMNLSFNDKSPRGNRSYSDAIMGARLETGKIEFGYRSIPWDSATFIGDDPSLVVIQGGYVDGDMSSGIHLFENIEVPGNGVYGTMLGSMPKQSILTMLDISGYNPNVVFDNTNLEEKGIVPYQSYAGPDGALGGSNYGHSQDGGSQVVWSGANDGEFQGSFSFTYFDGYYEGYEFHVTRDGRVFLVHDSIVQAFDLSTQEMTWEVSLGSQAHANVSVYNAVVYVSVQNGLLYGFDVASGKTLWKIDAFYEYGLSGLAAPSFSQGQAIWISNYILGNFDVRFGELGSTGLIMNVDRCLLTTPKDNVRSLVGGTVFESFDVTPRAPGATVNEKLLLNQFVEHKWSCHGCLTAIHYFDEEEPVEFKLKAKSFIYSSNQITFETYATKSGYRYVSLTMLNRSSYLLKFQRLEEGEWVNYEASLAFVNCVDAGSKGLKEQKQKSRGLKEPIALKNQKAQSRSVSMDKSKLCPKGKFFKAQEEKNKQLNKQMLRRHQKKKD